jgi:mono/diheme cytochrome c family protein
MTLWQIALVSALAGAFPAAPLLAAPAAAPPTFVTEVAPLLDRHCVRCHRPDGSAPGVSLVSYSTAKPWAESIKRKVLRREMPPWPVDPEHSVKFRNDARLNQADIDTVVAWVDAGAPRGEGPDPLLPSGARAWLHPQGIAPDAVVALPEYSLPASGEIPYVVRRVKVPFPEDKWIVAMQVRPGNEALVHHMGITEIALGEGLSLEQADAFAALAAQMGMPDGSAATTHPAVTDPSNPNSYDMLGVYTPGTTFESFGDGGGKLLKTGANYYLNFNIHYTPIGIPATDRSQLALWFAKKPVAHQLFRLPAAVETVVVNGRQLLSDDPGTKAEGTDVAIPPIPRYAENFEVTGSTAYTQPVTLYQLQPHAHMRGKDFTYSVVFPDGRERTLLTIPQYDFHWQLAYELESPLHLPSGSKLIVTAHYDNSANNPHLRNLGGGELARNCGPDKEAYFRKQNQTWHEMFSPLAQYSFDGSIGAGPGRSKHAALPLVEVAGCLGGEGGAWQLQSAGDPRVTKTQSTSAAERDAHRSSLGSRRFDLLGARIFRPDELAGHTVVVKGVLIGSGGPARINVTSLQSIAGTCAVAARTAQRVP